MAQHQQDSETAQGPSGRIVLAGVVIAAALGAGLGVWARSPPPPAPEAAEVQPPPLQPLQVVVDDTLPPVGQPLEVLPPEYALAAAKGFPSPAPQRPALRSAGLGAPTPVVALTRAPPSGTTAQARPSAARSRDPVRVAEATSKSAKPRKRPEAEIAKATTPRAKDAPAKSKPKSAAKLAEAAPPKVRKPLPPKTAPPAPRTGPASKAPPAAKPAPRGEGPVRVARNACVHSDPGAALVCADGRLGARDQQLQHAYRRAEAAGVPASVLRRREARWLEVRAAAAREAPWAVEDVYVARISEINDMIRDAREN